MTPPIAILGAGPGGLALARLLEMDNIGYTVFERDAHGGAVTTGGTLDIHADDGQKVLRAAGLFDEFKKLARYDAQTFKAADKHNNIIWDKRFDNQFDRPEIDRNDLRRMLLASVPTNKIHWGSRVEKVEKEEDGKMAVHLADGVVERGFKLVVGADGAWSKTRKLITTKEPVYSGFCYFQTTVEPSSEHYDRISKLVGPGTYTAMSGGNAIIAQQLARGEYMVYAGIKLPENAWKEETKLIRSPKFREHLLDTYFAGWASAPTDLIRHSTTTFHSWPLYQLPVETIPWSTVSGVALVGDAAHLATPNGEGVNGALMDSYDLAQEIKNHGLDQLDRAVAAYEQKMFPRGISSIEGGIEWQQRFFEADAPKGFQEWASQVDAMMSGNEVTA